MKIKIAFSDFWDGFNYNPSKDSAKSNNVFYSILSKRFNIEISDKPDYLIYSCCGNDHLKYNNCKKIFYTGENLRPDFKYCDYAITFDYTNNQNHLRFPLIALVLYEEGIEKTFNKNIDLEKIKNQKTKFCNFVFSNPAPFSPRNNFFLELSKYKKVDSGGGVFNNLGYQVKPGWNNKIEFLKDYKFTICFENSQYAGYTTEKLLHPMIANSIPVYWGDPEVGRDFNTKSFISAYNFNTTNEIIDYIKEIDNNDDMYYNILQEPYFKNGVMPYSLNYNTLLDFFENRIFN